MPSFEDFKHYIRFPFTLIKKIFLRNRLHFVQQSQPVTPNANLVQVDPDPHTLSADANGDGVIQDNQNGSQPQVEPEATSGDIPTAPSLKVKPEDKVEIPSYGAAIAINSKIMAEPNNTAQSHTQGAPALYNLPLGGDALNAALASLSVSRAM